MIVTETVQEHSKTTGRVYLKKEWIGKKVIIITEDE